MLSTGDAGKLQVYEEFLFCFQLYYGKKEDMMS